MITDVYDLKHDDGKIRDILFNELMKVVKSIIRDDDEFKAIRIKFAVEQLPNVNYL